MADAIPIPPEGFSLVVADPPPAPPDGFTLAGAPAAAPAGPVVPASPRLDALTRSMGVDPADLPEAKYGPGLRRAADDAVRSVASGATFGLADELAAGTKALGGTGTYAENVAAERARDAGISPFVRIPGELLGGALTGTGLSRAGLTLLNAAQPTVASMALRGAGEGAAYGAAYGFGNGEGAGDSLTGAAKGAGLGILTGGLTGAVAGKMAQAPSRSTAPTTEALKDQATAAYDASRAAGVAIAPEKFGGLVDDIAAAAEKAGLNDRLHPDASAVVDYLRAQKDQPLTLEKVDTLRQIVRDLGASAKPGEQRIGGIMTGKIDDFLDKLTPADVAAGDPKAAVEALTTARDLWGRMRKGEVIDQLMARAELAPSGYENGLRIQFRQLAMNPKRMRGFTDEERAAIRQVVKGGPIENVLRLVGKLAPTGAVSGAISSAAGGSMAGAPGAIAVPMLGAGARSAATSMTGRNAEAVSSLVRAGGAPAPAAPLSPRAQTLLQSLLIGEAQGAPNLLDALRVGGAPAGLGTR